MLVASSRAREFSLILNLFCKHLRHFIHRLVISFIRISPKLSEASNKVDLKKPAQCQINVNDFVWGLVLAGELASTGTLGRLDLPSTEGFNRSQPLGRQLNSLYSALKHTTNRTGDATSYAVIGQK